LKPELSFTFFFFIFYSFATIRFREDCSFGIVLLEAAIKHPQAPQGAIKSGAPFSFRGKELFYADEERSGGVAAIE
jgi:hypothetical protein